MSGAGPAAARRVVVAFTHGAAAPSALRAAAHFARLLDAELHGLLLEDEGLFAAAALSFTRHLDAALRWEPLSHRGLAEQYAAAAALLRRDVLRAAGAAGVVGRFAVARGEPAATLASSAASADWLAVLEAPGSPSAHLAGAWAERAQRAGREPATLHLPREAPARSGAVVAVVGSPDDPALALARRIAAAAGERLMVVDLASGPSAIVRAMPELVRSRAWLVVMQRPLFERRGAALAPLVDGHAVGWLLLGRGEQLL
jgi:hypothetical protein